MKKKILKKTKGMLKKLKKKVSKKITAKPSSKKRQASVASKSKKKSASAGPVSQKKKKASKPVSHRAKSLTKSSSKKNQPVAASKDKKKSVSVGPVPQKKKKASKPVSHRAKSLTKSSSKKNQPVAASKDKKKSVSVGPVPQKKKTTQKPVSQKTKSLVKSGSGEIPSAVSVKKQKKLSSAAGTSYPKTPAKDVLKRFPSQSAPVGKPIREIAKSPVALKAKPISAGSKKLPRSEEITMPWVEKTLQKIEAMKQEKKMIVRDMEGRDYCLFEDCDFPAVSGDYCRLHYIGRWDYIRMREKLLASGFIERKIQEILNKNSPSCIVHLIGDLSSEKTFLNSIKPFLEDMDDNMDEETVLVKETELEPDKENLKGKGQ